MQNGWRNALLAIWVIMAIAAAALAVVAVALVAKAQDDIAAQVMSNALPGVSLAAGGAVFFATTAFTVLLVWLAVSAVVREHEKDRLLRRREPPTDTGRATL